MHDHFWIYIGMHNQMDVTHPNMSGDQCPSPVRASLPNRLQNNPPADIVQRSRRFVHSRSRLS
jgi:hypothetical protein